jgi:hypothetical protein
VVVASVDTYLRFAEAAERLNLEATRKPGVPELLQGVTGAGAGAVSRPPAAVESANGAAALPAGERNHHDEREPVGVPARRRKERAR